jgi:hypothetical protein
MTAERMKQELTIDSGDEEGCRVLRRVCKCGFTAEIEAEAQGPLSEGTYARYLGLLERRLDDEFGEHRCPLS